MLIFAQLWLEVYSLKRRRRGASYPSQDPNFNAHGMFPIWLIFPASGLNSSEFLNLYKYFHFNNQTEHPCSRLRVLVSSFPPSHHLGLDEIQDVLYLMENSHCKLPGRLYGRACVALRVCSRKDYNAKKEQDLASTYFIAHKAVRPRSAAFLDITSQILALILRRSN